MILEPAPLGIYHLIHFSLIRYFLTLSLEEVVDIVSEKVIRDYVGFRTFSTLLARIRNTVGVIIVLRRSCAEYALLLQGNQIIDIVW